MANAVSGDSLGDDAGALDGGTARLGVSSIASLSGGGGGGFGGSGSFAFGGGALGPLEDPVLGAADFAPAFAAVPLALSRGLELSPPNFTVLPLVSILAFAVFLPSVLPFVNIAQA